MRVAALFAFLLASAMCAVGQTSQEYRSHEEILGQLEEIAMCHHAIRAAHHNAMYLGDNPYFRYICEAPDGHGANVYPIPERCKNLETRLILSYTEFSDKEKSEWDRTISSEIGMTISEIATDAQFFTAVIFKMNLEGKDAKSIANEDKDIPSKR